MDEELARSILNAINAQNQTLSNIDFYFRNQTNDGSPGPQRPPSYSGPAFNAEGVTGFFGKTLTNVTGDLSVYTDEIINVMERVIPGFAGLDKGSAEAAKAFVDFVQSNAETRNYLAKFGLDTEGELLRTYDIALGLNLSLSELGVLVSQSSQKLARLGGSVEGGTAALTNLQTMLRDDPSLEGYYEYLRNTGMTMQQVNEFFLDYLSTQRFIGLQDDEERRKRLQDGVEFRANLQALSEATGIAVDDFGQASGSAASIAAQLQYGSTEVMALAGFAGSQGLTALQTLLETGRFDPNDPQTKFLAAFMPEATRMASQFNAIMKQGGDITQEQQQAFLTAVQSGLRDMTRQYGDVAKIAGLDGMVSAIEGAGQFILGGDVDQAFAEQNAELQQFRDGVGQAAGSAAVLAGAQDNLIDSTRNVRYSVAGAADAFQSSFLAIAQEGSELVGTIAAGLAGMRDADVQRKMAETAAALEAVATEIEKAEKQGLDTTALKKEQEQYKKLDNLFQDTLAYRRGELTAADVKARNDELTANLSTEQVSDSLAQRILDINISEIGGRKVSAEDFAPFGYNFPEDRDPSVPAPTGLMDRFGGGDGVFWKKDTLNSNQQSAVRRLSQPDPVSPKDEQTAKAEEALITILPQLVETLEQGNMQTAELKNATITSGEKQANATRYSSQLMADRSLTAGFGQRIASTRGDVTRTG